MVPRLDFMNGKSKYSMFRVMSFRHPDEFIKAEREMFDLRNLPAPNLERDINNTDEAISNWSHLPIGLESNIEHESFWDKTKLKWKLGELRAVENGAWKVPELKIKWLAEESGFTCGKKAVSALSLLRAPNIEELLGLVTCSSDSASRRSSTKRSTVYLTFIPIISSSICFSLIFRTIYTCFTMKHLKRFI